MQFGRSTHPGCSTSAISNVRNGILNAAVAFDVKRDSFLRVARSRKISLKVCKFRWDFVGNPRSERNVRLSLNVRWENESLSVTFTTIERRLTQTCVVASIYKCDIRVSFCSIASIFPFPITIPLRRSLSRQHRTSLLTLRNRFGA